MQKKLIGLYVPAVGERFDLLAPADLNIAELTTLLTQGVEEMCSGRYAPSHRELLALQHPDMLLHPSKTLADYNVDDGAKLVLI